MTHPLATDIEAVARVGMDSWLERYDFPVPADEFMVFSNGLWDTIDCLMAALAPAEREAVLVDADYLFALKDVLHADGVRRWADRHGRPLVVGGPADAFYRPDWENLGHFDPAPERDRLRLLLRRTAKRFKAARAGRGGAPVWYFGSFAPMPQSYAVARGWRLRPHYAELLLGEDRPAPIEPPGPFRAAIAAASDAIAEIAAKHLGSGIAGATIADAWIGRLRQGLGWRTQVERRLGRAPNVALVSEVGRSVHRLVSFALRQRGTRIVGFTHGNEAGHVLQRYTAYTQYAQSDDYVCETDVAAREHEREYALGVLPRWFPVRFITAASPIHRAPLAAARRTGPPAAVRRVMVIGYPHNARRNQFDYSDFSIFHLDAEIRLLRRLKSAGYEPIYKIHPDRRAEAEAFFKPLAAVEARPFEAVVDGADAYVFLTTITSTFGVAMITARPVIALDFPGKPWNPALRDLVARRCTLVPAHFDSRNRIVYDETMLLAALAAKPIMPDFGYVEHALLPMEPTACAA